VLPSTQKLPLKAAAATPESSLEKFGCWGGPAMAGRGPQGLWRPVSL